MKNIIVRLFLISQLLPNFLWADADINFRGTLVEEPCVLDPRDSIIDIDFGSVISELLYSHQRTAGKTFNLHLLECDISLAETVSITFLGNEDLLQPGLIALDPSSTAKGVAIGIENNANQLIYINQPSKKILLKPGDNQLQHQIFISAEKDAIIRKNIIPGSFYSKVIFALDYQ